MFPGASLALSRTHEVFGTGARAFAAMTAGAAASLPGKEPVVWVRQACDRRRLNPLGLVPFLNPDRILLAECERPLDVLWTMEEALRLGPAGLVIAELAKPPDLKISRRLQLAAEAGGVAGLALVDDTPVSNASETRWFCAPSPPSAPPACEEKADSTHWRLSLIKNKRGTLGAWEIEWDAKARRIIVVSKIAGGSDGTARPLARSGEALRRGHGGEERAAALFPESGSPKGRAL